LCGDIELFGRYNGYMFEERSDDASDAFLADHALHAKKKLN
jgi:hypothetical protein